ncbi:MAG TPA: dTDP-glucose 4,6-dehydratase [Deinococcales bacterium]|nr:dTDP-glucose 4,6-dehydratase [Deinococcales bacterium]
MRHRSLLVTGGAGFIGSMAVHVLAAGHDDLKITVLDKLTYAAREKNLEPLLSGGRVRLVVGDVADPDKAREAMRGCEAVLHFAAESHVDRSLQDATPFIHSNVQGTLNLLQAARELGVARFLHVSTDEVYGDVSGTDRHSLETDRFEPRSPYSASKAAAEHLVQAFHASYGLDAVITRGSNTYGPRQYPEKIIPLFTLNALAGRPLPVYGRGGAVRDYLHAQDHVTGILTALERGESGRAYNVGAREQVNGLDLAKRLLALTGRGEDLIEFVPDRPGHDYRYSVDPGKLEALGWTRRWTFERGLEDTVNWYANHREWWQ